MHNPILIIVPKFFLRQFCEYICCFLVSQLQACGLKELCINDKKEDDDKHIEYPETQRCRGNSFLFSVALSLSLVALGGCCFVLD